ncbi:MAG: transglutaminase-like domain-containing protein [Patescibacteria group bacterium]
MKKIFYLLIGLFVYGIIPHPISAVGEFTADYEVSYVAAPTGQTIVTQNITLTNRLTNLYPKQYAITIDSENIKDVIAYDKGGVIRPQISQKDGKTEILLTFNEQVVGLGKKLNFTLRFESGDIAQKHGLIWEINVPAVAADPDLGSYNLTLDVPASFGSNAYLSPPPSSGRRWTKDQMTRGGITAAYGTKQNFNLDLSYYLENSKVTPQIAEIALPPDTAFQKVTLEALSPKPETVARDADGNWLARYNLAPNQKLEVTASLGVDITLNPRPDFSVPLENLASYLKSDRYWETTNPKIVALAQQYRTPHEIYEYVTRTLAYDYNRVNQNPIRKGAVAALDSPKNSICMEFTDLFIAIARAAGIPAREVVGYAYTTNSKLRPLSLVSDVLHAWPEYYDQERKLWISVDPTWANTTGGLNYFDKLDFNHVVFAIHGASSDYPYPAGFYRKAGRSGRDVKVSFAAAAPLAAPSGRLTTTFKFPKTVTAGFPVRGEVIVENNSSSAIPEATIVIQATPFAFSLVKQESQIPPLSKISFPVNLTPHGYLTRARGRLAVAVNGETSDYYFEVKPMYAFLLPVGAGIGLILLGLGYLIAKPRIWLKPRKS